MTTMKYFLFTLLSLLVFNSFTTPQSQLTELDRKVKKGLKKRAKQLKKEGYIPVGSASILMYLEKGYKYESETDEDGSPKFLIQNSEVVAGSYIPALNNVKAAVRSEMATNIQTKVFTRIQLLVGNDEISREDAASVNESTSKSIQEASEIVHLQDIYILRKDVGAKNVKILYSGFFSERKLKATIKERLRKKSDDLIDNEDIEFLLDW